MKKSEIVNAIKNLLWKGGWKINDTRDYKSLKLNDKVRISKSKSKYSYILTIDYNGRIYKINTFFVNKELLSLFNRRHKRIKELKKIDADLKDKKSFDNVLDFFLEIGVTAFLTVPLNSTFLDFKEYIISILSLKDISKLKSEIEYLNYKHYFFFYFELKYKYIDENRILKFNFLHNKIGKIIIEASVESNGYTKDFKTTKSHYDISKEDILDFSDNLVLIESKI